MYQVTCDINEVNLLPSSELEEILQNVKTILATVKGTVPLDRDFGVDHRILDLPVSVAQAKISAAIVKAINKFEPRARVQKIFYDNTPTNAAESNLNDVLPSSGTNYQNVAKNALDGILKPRVVIKIVEENLRGYVLIED